MNAEIVLTPAQVQNFREWADRNPDGIPTIREEVLEAVSEARRERMLVHVILTGSAHGG